MSEIQFVRIDRLWIAHLYTRYGHMESLCGEGDEPDLKSLVLLKHFLDGAEDHIATIRSSVFRIPRLWRPIRFAINNEGRLGLQFMHRITGKQEGMFFADNHSSFTMNEGDVKISDEELKRFREHGIIGSP